MSKLVTEMSPIMGIIACVCDEREEAVESICSTLFKQVIKQGITDMNQGNAQQHAAWQNKTSQTTDN